MNLTTWAWLIVPLGATRALQILLWDRITERPRRWLLRRLNPRGLEMTDPERPYLSYLIECPWCASVWLGGLLVALLAWGTTRAATLAVLLALALSLAAVLIDRLIDRTLPDQPHQSPPPSPPSVVVQQTFAEPVPEHVAEAFAQQPTGDREPGGNG